MEAPLTWVHFVFDLLSYMYDSWTYFGCSLNVIFIWIWCICFPFPYLLMKLDFFWQTVERDGSFMAQVKWIVCVVLLWVSLLLFVPIVSCISFLRLILVLRLSSWSILVFFCTCRLILNAGTRACSGVNCKTHRPRHRWLVYPFWVEVRPLYTGLASKAHASYPKVGLSALARGRAQILALKKRRDKKKIKERKGQKKKLCWVFFFGK